MDGTFPPYTPDDWLIQIDCKGDIRLEAAFELASELHETHKRDNGHPYVEHTNLVYNILQKFGCNDVQKAVGLLHDTIEEKAGLTPIALMQQLAKRIKRKMGLSDAQELPLNIQHWAKQVCEGVDQLTNGTFLYEGKRTWQADHVRGLSDEMKEVKIADQASTVIEAGILYCNLYDAQKMKREKGFALKGLDVARNCIGKDNKAGDKVHQFVNFYENGVLECFRDNYDDAQQGNYLLANNRRDALNIGELIVKAMAGKLKSKKRKKIDDVIAVYNPAFTPQDNSSGISSEYPEQGLACITITAKTPYKVVQIGTVVAEGDSNEHPANKVASSLREKIEDEHRADVTTGHRNPLARMGLEEHGGRMQVRNYIVNPPMPLARLLELAKEENAIDPDFYDVMQRKARTLRAVGGRGGRG